MFNILNWALHYAGCIDRVNC